MHSTMSAGRASTSFGIHKSDVPVTIIDAPPNDFAPIHEYEHELRPPGVLGNSSEMSPCVVSAGRTTVFEAMPGPQPSANTRPQPLRVPQPPSFAQTAGMRTRLHSATPSTSSLNTTTFPAVPTPGSTSSLPAFHQLPAGVRRSAQPSLSSSLLPSYSQLTSSSSTLPHRRPPQHVESMNARPPLTMSNSSNSMSRADLIEIARRKQSQIDANHEYLADLERQQAALLQSKRQGGVHVNAEIENRRKEIQRDEHKLELLGAAKRDVRGVTAVVNQHRQLLHQMNDQHIGGEVDLRAAASQIHSLRQQRDLMHQRRADAANRAIALQRRQNGLQKSGESTSEEIYGQVNKPPMVRPKASVGPFQVKHQQLSSASLYEKPRPPSYDELDAMRQSNRTPMRTIDVQNGRRAGVEMTDSSGVLRTSAVDTFVIRSDSLKSAKRRSWAHDPHARAQNPAISSAVLSPPAAAPSQQPKRVVVAPTSAIISPVVKRIPVAPEASSKGGKEVVRKTKKNLSLASLFGRRSSSKEAKKAATVAVVPLGQHPAEEKEEAEVLPKQEPLMPADEKLEPVEPPAALSTPQKPVEQKTEAEEKFPDAPTVAATNSKPTISAVDPVQPSTVRCPLAAADEDEEEEAEEVAEEPIQPPRLSVHSKQPLEVTTITLLNADDELPDRESSASPPEDPQQMRDNESTASSVEDEPTPVAAETPPLSVDEQRMLAAANEIARQLNELEVDNLNGRGIDTRTNLPADFDNEEAERTVTIIRQQHGRFDYDEDEEDDLLQDEHGVQIRPYVVVERQHSDEEDEERQTTTEEASSNDGESTTTDEPQFDEIQRPQLKGILRPVGMQKPKRKMIFDPLVIFLDASLEGELDLVMETAAKIPDISQANEEGITALHNAICAAHYEIVKFLVQKHADVNAQDADGWTPLHCAASCNNLPLAKLLIENGACVFAMSLSDGETPAQKVEESVNGYDGCTAFLEAADKCMGVINDRKIYAAFAYETEREDELPFAAGEELRVVNRETGERGFHQPRAYSFEMQLPMSESCLWWECENAEGKRGLVPRNFFGLYPAWPHSQQHAVEPFELPSNAVALEAFLKKHAAADDSPSSRRDSTATLDPQEGQQTSSGTPDSAASEEVRDDDSPPPLPKPEFDANVQISAHA